MKTSLKKLSLFISAAVLAVALAFCGNPATTGENAGEKDLSRNDAATPDQKINDDAAIGKDDTDDRVNEVISDDWPAEIPADVPEFQSGKIHSTVFEQGEKVKTWKISLEEIDSDAFENYEALLKQKDYATKKALNPEGGYLAGEKGRYSVNLMVNKQGKQIIVYVRD